MSVATILFIVAIVLAAVDLINTRGRALTSWAVVAVCVGLLYGALG